MKKSYYIATLVVIIIIAAVYLLVSHRTQPSRVAVSPSYENATYTIDGQSVTLVDGSSTVAAAPDSVSVIKTQYFGDETGGDVNGDGLLDAAFILTQDSGGSGTFYYVVVALKTPTGYIGTNAIFLGDRIAPQSIQIVDGTIIVNYADRKATDPMTTAPSVGVTKYFVVQGDTLVLTSNRIPPPHPMPVVPKP